VVYANVKCVERDIEIILSRQPLNSLLVLNENMLATGDDQGVIKVLHAKLRFKEGQDAKHVELIAVGQSISKMCYDLHRA
jgi:hypothetical protein